jgi:hypothetical protein
VGKVLKSVAIAAVLIGISFIPGVGPALSTALRVAAFTTVLSGATAELFGPKAPKTQFSRLNVSLDPGTPRKAVFGTTAMPLDLRYHESSGTDQEYIDYIIAVAAHKVASIDEIWFEEKQAWTASGGVTATYAGYLAITTRTEGTSANYISINGGSKWGSSRRLTGCAYVHFRVKRTGNDKKAESPLVNGLPSRVTIIGNGALLYDPRKDSTVAGGSGSHRATDQSTWGAYTNADDTDNPALQLLWWLLGWEINNKLSIGCGVPYTRIDMASFITAANICDENVTLAIGGTQKRYRTSGTASDGDDRMEIINNLLASMNGTIRDNSGKLMLTVMKNDLADYALVLDENNMVGGFEWQQTGGLTENKNVARGRYVDPSANSLYQFIDYPEVGFASPDGIDRVMSLDLFYVEDGRRAQRIAKQALQRNQYRGMFSATFNAKALGCQVGDIVWLNLETLGWVNKPFRVMSQEIRFDGQVPMALIEENAAIYAWSAEDSAPIIPTAPTIYDPLNNPFILGIADAQAVADGKIDSFYQATMPTTGSVGDLWIDTDDGNKLYRHNGITFIEVQDDGISAAIVAASDAQATADGKVTTFYIESTPTAEAIGDLWYRPSTGYLTRWNGSAWVDVANVGATAAQISSIATALSDAANAQATADGKIDSYYQASMPTGTVGDLWFDTDDGNKQYRHNGTTFVAVQDAGIGIAISDAAGAQATADGKVTTFISETAPTAEGVGDLWFKASTGELRRWSGSAWGNALVDLTGVAVPSLDQVASVAFSADYLGVLSAGQLPKTINVIRRRGGVDVSSTTTWSIVSQTGISGVTVTISSSGIVTIPSGATIGASSNIEVRSVRDGTTLDARISVTRNDAPPPSTGSAGGTTVNDSTFNSVSTTSFAAISDLMTVRTGSSGQIQFAGALTTTCESASPTGSFNIEMKWQYRTIGGSFADAATAVNSDPDTQVYFDGDYFTDDGFVDCSPLKTGLSASTDYEVQLFARRTTSSPTKSIFFIGTASAVGS